MKVLTVGTFDLFHEGHYNLIDKCIELSYTGYGTPDVVVGINSDQFIERYKGKPPIMDYFERKSIIEKVFTVKTCKNEQHDGTIKDLIKEHKPEIIVIGTDWHRKDYLAQIGLDEDYLEEAGISLVYVPYTKDISTTEIKRRITDGELSNLRERDRAK